jgi:methionyl aminopeptidase
VIVMEAEVLEKYMKAGKILSQVCEMVRPRVQVGVSLLEIAEMVERSTKELGGELAFPCNISLNRIAAHYTPRPEDDLVFGEDMVKLDLGVHVDGYIADAAVTVDLSGHPDMVEASKEALNAAIELVSPGVNTRDLGAAIEQAITGYGFKPVGNLTGHGLERYSAHAEPTIPNRAMDLGRTLQVGEVIAIEPFATDGLGRISEGPVVEIYGFSARRPVRSVEARELMKQIQERFGALPFARRWLEGERIDYALAQLLRAGIIHRYPILWEAEGALVAQSEHTVIVTENGCKITTL